MSCNCNFPTFTYVSEGYGLLYVRSGSVKSACIGVRIPQLSLLCLVDHVQSTAVAVEQRPHGGLDLSQQGIPGSFVENLYFQGPVNVAIAQSDH